MIQFDPGVLLANEGALRLLGFAFALVVLIAAERWRPFRSDARPERSLGVSPRQRANFALALIDTALLRFAFPLLAVGLAVEVERRGGGLFGMVAWPGLLEGVVAVLVFDFAIYWQHRATHRVAWLWPLHRVHHSDLAIDVSTGLRFHPLEIALSMGIKLGLVALLGPAPLAVMVFELWLSVGSLFTHANIALPARVESTVRALLVTPTMHRIHHSLRREETDSNYGFNLSLWDRLFGSYRSHALQPPREMLLGLASWRDAPSQRLRSLLLQPLKRDAHTRSNEGPRNA